MKKNKLVLNIGIVLIIISIPFFLLLLAIPFLDINKKAQISLGLLISGEILFWAGGILVGKELFAKYKSYLNPKNWFNKKTEKKSSEDKAE